MPNPIIQADGLIFAYPGHEPVLDNVSLQLNPGQRVGLIGPNGSGKTTLAHVILGLIKPDQGSLRLFGQKMLTEKDFARHRGRIGLLFQHADDQLFYPTVLEDVAFGPLNMGLDPKQAEARARETLDRLGLSGFEDRVTHHLSGGEKKLVALATVLAMEPSALFLDEPSNELDTKTRQRLIHILDELDQACVIISHDWDFLARTTSEVWSLRHGAISFEGPVAAHEHVHVHEHGDLPHTHDD